MFSHEHVLRILRLAPANQVREQARTGTSPEALPAVYGLYEVRGHLCVVAGEGLCKNGKWGTYL